MNPMNQRPQVGAVRGAKTSKDENPLANRSDSFVLGGFVGLGAFVLCQCVNIPNPWKGIICFFIVLMVQIVSTGCLKLLLEGHKLAPPDNWGKSKDELWGEMPGIDAMQGIGEAAKILREFKDLQKDIPDPEIFGAFGDTAGNFYSTEGSNGKLDPDEPQLPTN